MKIGILTFHRAYNYGAVLQTYALQYQLQELGYETYIIDYNNKAVYANYKLINIKRILRRNPIKLLIQLSNEIYKLPQRLNKKRIFERFIKKYYCLLPLSEISKLDIIVVGSDQVWNPNITNGFDNMYFGAYINKTIPLISYAASSEKIALSNLNESNYKSVINRFNYISVREKIFADYLRRITDRPIDVVLDPTLILKRSVWNSIVKSDKFRNEKYVVVYQARYSDKILAFAEKIANQLKSKIIVITSNVGGTIEGTQYEFVSNTSPMQFVNYFFNAQCAIALSFHAVAFSIISQIPFYAIKMNDGWDNRVESLLSELNLLNRFVPVDSNISYSPIDYSMANKKIDELRDFSIKWLKNAIIK
jgi:hypothetical protein